MYDLKIKPQLDKLLSKMSKREKNQLLIIGKKVNEILKDPHHYKNLHRPLEDWKRVHIDKHFVLIFSVNEKTKTVTLEDYDHHDNIYRKHK